MEKAETQKAISGVIKLTTKHVNCHFEEGTTEN